MKTIPVLLTVLAALLLFSCGSGEKRLAPELSACPCEVSGSISTGGLSLEGTLSVSSAETAALAVSAPSQLAGYVWTMGAEGFAVSHSGVTAPLTLPPPSLAMLAEALAADSGSLISAEVTELGGQGYTRAVYHGALGEITVYYAAADSDALAPVRIEYGEVTMNITEYTGNT